MDSSFAEQSIDGVVPSIRALWNSENVSRVSATSTGPLASGSQSGRRPGRGRMEERRAEPKFDPAPHEGFNAPALVCRAALDGLCWVPRPNGLERLIPCLAVPGRAWPCACPRRSLTCWRRGVGPGAAGTGVARPRQTPPQGRPAPCASFVLLTEPCLGPRPPVSQSGGQLR